MKVLRAGDHKRMPWKNGGGETVEIAVSPEGAGLSDFDWRLSMATVASDGPFSIFPGIDRTLSILDGAGMTLSIEGQQPVQLTQESAPLSFPADSKTSATLLDGEITDLNVMTHRSVLTHSVERIEVGGEAALERDGSTILLFCRSGSVDISTKEDVVTLKERDCLLNPGKLRLVLSGKAVCFLIILYDI